MKNRLSSIKDQLIENQKLVISAQESIIDCKEKQLQKQLQAVQTVVKDTVESQFKSYSDTVQDSGKRHGLSTWKFSYPRDFEGSRQVCGASRRPEQEHHDFGLPEDLSKDLNRTVGDIFEEIELKPAMKLNRGGKLKEKTIRPVKVTLSSSSTVYEPNRYSVKLESCDSHQSAVFISPDHSLEDRVKHRLHVKNLQKNKNAEPNKHHYIKGATIHSEDKSAR